VSVFLVAIVGSGSSSAAPRNASAPAAAPFAWFVSAPAPPGWKHLTLPSRRAVLWFPPTLNPIHSDKQSVSAARVDRNGGDLAYLNATPQQGDEQLATWPAFRIETLLGETAAVATREGQALGLTFRGGGKGSCVIDTYVTRIKQHVYREIACFVRAHGAGTVVVAAAPITVWARYGPVLERAISAYEVTTP